MAEDAKMLSGAPKWFQFLELKWLQPTGSHFPWYASLLVSWPLDGYVCCSHGMGQLLLTTRVLTQRPRDMNSYMKRKAVTNKEFDALE